MCGICGILDLKDRSPDPEVLTNMRDALRHRGPDGVGVIMEREIGFGHARLSIIDLCGGHQPMQSADHSTWITFNGEIFNYIELRKELIAKGRHFATTSDTEVLLQLYEEEGEECVKKLNGQWAFAIWDGKERKLFLSRDRMGILPLFFSEADRQFLFASEIKALFQHPAVAREIDPIGVQQMFTFWHMVPPRTEFNGISELPPGHSLTVQNGRVRTYKWFELDLSPNDLLNVAYTGQEEEISEALAELLVRATRLRLRADVPVGAYLSGGLDSSLITALVYGYTNSRLETFSIAFDDAEYDESAFQYQVAAHLGTRHHSLRCSYDDIGKAFPDVVWHAERTLLRTAPAPMYLLSAHVHESGFKVILTGEGADELLGGYDIFKETKIRSFWMRQPTSKLRPQLLRRMYPYMQQIQSQPQEYLKIFFRAREEDFLSPFYSHLPRWEMTRKTQLLFSESLTAELDGRNAWEKVDWRFPHQYESWDVFQRAQFLETTYLLPGYILSSQGDRPAMANAVEGRFPFLDPQVVEFACRLPSVLKMRGLDAKHLLKRSAKPLLPASVIRRPKQPYRSPDVRCFMDNGTFRHEYVAEMLSPEALRKYGVFHPPAVQSLVEKLKRQPWSATTRDSMALTGVISTQLLFNQYIERNIARGNHGRDTSEDPCVYHR